MENSSFDEGIKNLNRSLRGIQSEFKNATSGLKEHGKGLDGLKAKQEMLSKSLDVQSKVVSQYKDKLKESKNALSENREAQVKLKEKVEGAKKAYEESKNVLGENSNKTKELKTNYEKLSEEYVKNEEKLRTNVRTIDNWNIKVNNAEAKLKGMESELSSTSKEIEKQSSCWNALSNKLDSVGKKFKSVGDKMSSIGKEMSTKVSLPIVGLGIASAKAAIDFESAFAGVTKTVDGTKEQFKQLEEGITNMSKNLPSSAVEISAVAESAGQLGIQTDNILGFTKTIIDLGNATNLVGEEGASQLAKFANITQMSQRDFDRLGSVIVDLGNNMATTEADIVAMGMRLAGAGTQIGLTEAQIMGLSAGLSSVGIEAEAGGSAFSKVMVEMQLAVETSSDSLEDFAEVAGMSAEQFQTAFKEDAAGALIAFIEGLGKSEEKGSSAIKVLTEMGIEEVRMRDALLRASSAGDLFNKSMQIGSDAWRENTALVNEANQRYATTESKLQMAKNQIVDSARVIGENLIPIVRDITVKIAEITKRFSQLSPETQQNIIKFSLLAAAIGPILFIGGKLIKIIGGIATIFGTVSGAIAVATTGAVAATPAIGALAGVFTALTGPIGIAIAAVGLIGVAVYESIKHFDVLKEKFESLSAIGKIFTGIVVATNPVLAAVAGITLAIKGIQTAMSPAIESTKEFGSEISKETQEAIGAYEKLDTEVGQKLMNIKVRNEKISKETADALVNNFAEMSNQITTKMDENFNKDYETMNSFMLKSGTLRDEDSKKVLNNMQEHHNFEVEIVEEGQARIDEIIRTAAAENRDWTIQEENEINTIKENMMREAINTMSQGEVEQRSLLERQKHNASVASAEQAAEVVKNSIEQRDKTIEAAEEEYDKTVQAIIKQRDEAGTISDEQAKTLIEAAKHQKEETVNQAQGMHEEIIMEAQNQAKEHADKVDWETGEIKSKWQVACDTVSKKAVEMKNNTINAFNEKKQAISNKMNEIKSDIENKWNTIINWFDTLPARLKQKAHTMFSAMKQGMVEKIVEIKDTAKVIGDGIISALESIPVDSIGKDIVLGLANGIRNMASEAWNAAKELANGVEERIKKALDIRSPSRVMKQLGQYTSQGLALGILEDMDKVEKASRIAAETIKSITEGALSDIKVKTNTNGIEIKDRTSRQLNWGTNNKNEYAKYVEFVNKLNKEEVENSKECLKEDYENRKAALEERIRILKDENSIELKEEKAKIDTQIAYLEKLSRNTTNKDGKKKYANEIANLRQYKKEVLDTTKENQKSQVESLEKSKRALDEYYKNGTKLLDNREKEIKKSLKTQENVLKDLITTYDTAIKQLSISTGDCIKDLENQEAIVVIQSKKVEELRKRYEELALAFGVTASETVKAREQFESARIELGKMADKVSEASKKIADKINKFQKDIMNALKERYKEQQELQEEAIKRDIEALENWKDDSISRINAVYDSKIKAIEEASNAQIEALERELKALEDTEKANDRKEKDKEELKNINKIKLEIDYEHDDYNKEQLQKQLDQAIINRQKRLEKQALDDKKEKLKNEISSIRESTANKKEELEIQKKNEIANINEIYKSEKEIYQKRSEELRKFYDQKTKDAQLQAEAEKLIMEKNQDEIVELLKSYSAEYKNAGRNLGDSLVEGFKPAIKEIQDLIASITKEINKSKQDALNLKNSLETSERHSNTVNRTINNKKTNNYHISVNSSNVNTDIESTIRNLAFTM